MFKHKSKGMFLVFAAALLAASLALGAAAPAAAAEEGYAELTTVRIAEYDGKDEDCDTLIVCLDEELNVTDRSGNSLGTLDGLQTDAVLCYYIKDEQTAAAFAQYAAEHSLQTGMILSDDPACVAAARNANAACLNLSGAVDFRGKTPTVAEVQSAVNANMAKTALFDASFLTAEKVRTLQKLLINVWCDAQTEAEAYSALAYGCTGILSRALDLTAAVTGSEYAVLSPRPILVAHRGCSEGAGRENLENTVAAAKLAYERGAEAVEIDVHVTADGHLVIMHNDTIQGTTDGSGYIEQLSLQDLRRYKVNGTEEIPLLTDYFEEFQDDDLYFFIEIKSSKTNVAAKLKEAIDEYGMQQKCSFISFNGTQLAACRSLMPEISVGYLDGSIVCANENDDSVAAYTQQVIAKCNALNTSYHGDYNVLTDRGIRSLAAQGVATNVYTLNTSQELFSYYAGKGVASVTTDYAVWLQNYAQALTAVDDTVTGTPANLNAHCTTFGGGSLDYRAELILLDGEDAVSREQDGYAALRTQDVTAVAVINCYDENYQLQFTLLSAPFTLHVQAAGGLDTVWIVLIAVAAAAVLLCAGYFVFRAVKKHSKKHTDGEK